MSDEQISLALSLVKTRLNRLDAALDDYLTARVRSAYGYLTGQGLHLDLSETRDLMLLVDTAVYQYGSRDSDAGEPAWLRMQIRQRWLMERGEAE